MIITNPDLLRFPCEDVQLSEIDELRQKLETELNNSESLGFPGIGLACPQIGIYKKMAIVRVPLRDGKLIKIDLVNCQITAGYDKAVFDNEGCLSFPDRVERTLRYQEILVEGNLVEPKRFIAQGLVAVVIQHELDHLSGILLPDVALK